MTLKERPPANIFGPKGGRTLENFTHVGRFSIFDTKIILDSIPPNFFSSPLKNFSDFCC